MTTLDYPNIAWRSVGPDNPKKPDPLAHRIDQAAAIYYDRTRQCPNVVLLRQDDHREAEPEYRCPLPSGQTAQIAVMLSPFGGPGRDILIGRKETEQE